MNQHDNSNAPDNLEAATDVAAEQASSQQQQPHSKQAASAADEASVSALGGSESSGGGDDVLDMIENVDRQLQRIKEAKKIQDEEVRSLAKRFEEVEQAERELAAARTQLEQRERDLAEQVQAAKGERAELDQQREDFAQREADLKQQYEGLASREAEIQQQREEIDQRRDELSCRLEKAEANVGELMQQVESLNEQLEQRASLLEAAQQERESFAAQLAERDATIQQHQSKLEIARKKLAEYATVLAEQAEQVEQAAGAAEMVQRQQEQIAKLSKQLAESAGNASAADMAAQKKHEQRIAELEQAIATAESAAAEATAKADRQQQEIERLNTQIAAAPAEADPALAQTLQQREQRIAELEQSLEAASETKSDIQSKAAKLVRITEHLRRRQSRLRALRKASRQSPRAPKASSNQIIEDPQTRAAAIEALHRKSQQIAEKREELATVEQKMIRRWARPRAVVVTGWLFIVMCLNAAAGWLAVEHFVPAERTATVVMTAGTPGASLNIDQMKRWQEFHTAIVSDDAFIALLARRYAEQRLDGRPGSASVFSDPKRLAGYFDENLAILPDASGLIISLSGQDVWKVSQALDILASTLAAESARQIGNSASADKKPPAVARPAPSADGRIRFAVADPWRLTEERLTLIGIAFGITMGATLMLIVFVYTRLVRAKRVFDEENEIILT